MKLTKKTVAMFEEEQQRYGTEVALYNVIWLLAAEVLQNIGVTRVRTTTKRRR